jgi:hypothetical protein
VKSFVSKVKLKAKALPAGGAVRWLPVRGRQPRKVLNSVGFVRSKPDRASRIPFRQREDCDMGIFSRIMDKLRAGPLGGGNRKETATPGSERVAQQQTQDMAGNTGFQQQAAPQNASQGQPAIQNVDVEQVLENMAKQKGGGGNWRTSIVDLLKLLDLDSSLEARKELAQELGVNAGAHGSAEQNIALQKAVWKKLAENGGRVPQSLRD